MTSTVDPVVKNRHMRRMAYVSLVGIVGLTVAGVVTGAWAPSHVYYTFTGIVGAWAGFSKWGEINNA